MERGRRAVWEDESPRNHRITHSLRLGGTSGGLLVQPTLLQQNHLEPVALGHVQMTFEYFQEGRICKPS